MPDDTSHHPSWLPRPRPPRCETCGDPLHRLPQLEAACPGCGADGPARFAARGIGQLETMLAVHAALRGE
jgi:hypothetical protein